MRIDFTALPAPVRTAVEARTGRVHASRTAEAGVNSAVATLLETDGGRVFLKGVPDDGPGVIGQQREADVNPHLAGIAPRMLWHEQAAGWDLIAFEAIDGHHADYVPGSPDLPRVAAVIEALTRTPCPPISMPSALRQWGRYLDDPDDARHFDGNHLLHTDANPTNYLIAEHGARLVDWAWATRGAAFIDVALLLPRLIGAGHSVGGGEEWAGQFGVWQDADPAAVALFAVALSRLFRRFADRNPGDEWRRELADAASAWAEFRAGVPAV